MSEDLTDYLKDVGVKVAYLHSEVETIQRAEIIRDLTGKESMIVLSGSIYLEKVLDIPEVSLVAF